MTVEPRIVLRQTDKEGEVIVSALPQRFGAKGRVWQSASRVDDARRGGDIDLRFDRPTVVAFPRNSPCP